MLDLILKLAKNFLLRLMSYFCTLKRNNHQQVENNEKVFELF